MLSQRAKWRRQASRPLAELPNGKDCSFQNRNPARVRWCRAELSPENLGENIALVAIGTSYCNRLPGLKVLSMSRHR